MTTRIYERVSTTKQKVDSQHSELERWAHGREGVKWYPADKFTGKSMDRPSFVKIMSELRRGDTLVVYRLDRLGRTASGLTRLFEELQERGVNFISITDAIDLSTASGRMLAGVLASVAQYETECRAERVKAGIEARKAKIERGEIVPVSMSGRPKGTGKVTPALRETILRLKSEGKGVSHIARQLHLSRQTVHNVIRNGNEE